MSIALGYEKAPSGNINLDQKQEKGFGPFRQTRGVQQTVLHLVDNAAAILED